MSTKNRSLVELILSHYFKDCHIVIYLKAHIGNQEVVDALVTKLRSLPEKRLLDVIPNVIYVFRNSLNKSLELFLSEMCQFKFEKYLIVRWAFDAYTFNNTLAPELAEKFQYVRNKLDSTLINGCELDFKGIPQEELTDKIMAHLNQKQQRSAYVNHLNDFYNSLAKISLKLKGFEQAARNIELKEALKKYYNRLLARMSQRKVNKISLGAYFPICQESSFLVSICYDYCYTFSTKQRVPYKIVFETVDHNELLSKHDYIQEYLETVPNKQYLQEQEDSGEEHVKSMDSTKTEKETAEKLNQYLEGIKKYGSIVPKEEEKKKTVSSLKLQHSYFEEEWQLKIDRIKEKSAFKEFKSLEVRAYLVKGGDDLRQQHFALQLIKMVADIFKEINLKLWIRPYDIIMLSRNSGFIQYLPNTMTISSLKKYGSRPLKQIYQQVFGDQWDIASHNFTTSMAGYSLIQYLFQIKDRHNGNILIDSSGHMIHIDFSFLLTNSPGNINFEKAPFKLIGEYIELMGGKESDMFNYYKELLFIGFSTIRKYKKQILDFIDTIMQSSDLPCFKYYNRKDIAARFMETATDQELKKHVDNLIYEAEYSRSTLNYDRFQQYTNGICYR